MRMLCIQGGNMVIPAQRSEGVEVWDALLKGRMNIRRNAFRIYLLGFPLSAFAIPMT